MNEIVKPTMSEKDARRITERIRFTAQSYIETEKKLLRLVQEAKEGSAHQALGYSSWTAYLSETLGDEPMRLERDQRQAVVRMLSDEGMSTRAIAPIVGVSNKTVSQDRREVLPEVTPKPKSDAELLAGAEWSPAAVEDEPRFTDEPGRGQPVTGTITGMDGKTYTRPEPKEHKPKAEAITSQFSSAIVDLNRLLDRFHRISTNENFQKNKGQIATLHGNDLARAISELQNLADQLN